MTIFGVGMFFGAVGTSMGLASVYATRHHDEPLTAFKLSFDGFLLTLTGFIFVVIGIIT
jgi:hypothetical protein